MNAPDFLAGNSHAVRSSPSVTAVGRVTFPSQRPSPRTQHQLSHPAQPSALWEMRFKADLKNVSSFSQLLNALVPLSKLAMVKLKPDSVHLICLADGPGPAQVWW